LQVRIDEICDFWCGADEGGLEAGVDFCVLCGDIRGVWGRGWKDEPVTFGKNSLLASVRRNWRLLRIDRLNDGQLSMSIECEWEVAYTLLGSVPWWETTTDLRTASVPMYP
jgi:hypothetical protein